ncbi:MAG TPA: HAD-IA family hydrolase [Thermoplasmata archaeon]|nr:HAD-IA family hydrolase [Thermoplasmata archaeon]
MRPRTVFLDWGGTLAQPPLEFREPWTVWRRVLAAHRHPVAEPRLRRALDATTRELGPRIYDYLGRTPEYWRVHDQRVMDLLRIRESRGPIEDGIQRVFDDPSLVVLYPEARTVLTALRDRGYRTGIVSNHHEGLLRVVDHHGLRPLVDTVTFSQEARAEKPDPRIFALALRRAGCAASEAVHVGDSLRADVEGARGAGLRPVWLNRSRSEGSPGCPTIASLDELLPLLDAGGPP